MVRLPLGKTAAIEASNNDHAFTVTTFPCIGLIWELTVSTWSILRYHFHYTTLFIEKYTEHGNLCHLVTVVFFIHKEGWRKRLRTLVLLDQTWLISSASEHSGSVPRPAWISNHMPSKVGHEITFPFPKFSGCTVEVWELISNFIQ